MKKSLIYLLCSLFAFGEMEVSADDDGQPSDVTNEAEVDSGSWAQPYFGVALGYLHRSSNLSLENAYYSNAEWPGHVLAPMYVHVGQRFIEGGKGSLVGSFFAGVRFSIGNRFSIAPELMLDLGQNKTKDSEKEIVTAGAAEPVYISKLKDKGTSVSCRVLAMFAACSSVRIYLGSGVKFGKMDYEFEEKVYHFGANGSWNTHQVLGILGVEYLPCNSKKISLRAEWEHAFKATKNISHHTSFDRPPDPNLESDYSYKLKANSDKMNIAVIWNF